MDDYVERMLNEFPTKFKAEDKQETPTAGNLFEPAKGGPLEPISTISVQESQIGYWSNRCCTSIKSQGPNSRGLASIGAIDVIPTFNKGKASNPLC